MAGNQDTSLMINPAALESISEDVLDNANTILAYDDFRAVRFDTAWDPHPASKRQRLGYNCAICDTSFTERRALRRHERTPAHCIKAGLPVKEPTCLYCKKSFSRDDILRRHIVEVHARKGRNMKVMERSQNLFSPPQPKTLDSPRRLTAAPMKKRDPEAVSHPHERAPTRVRWAGRPSSTEFLESRRFMLGHSTIGSETHPNNVQVRQSYLATMRRTDKSVASNSSYSPNSNISVSEVDAASTTSTTSSLSIKSAPSVTIPFRSRLLPLRRIGRNARPRPLKHVLPCPLCKNELGSSSQEVKKHIDNHLDDLTDISDRNRCQKCEINFVHEQDLIWHLRSIKVTKTCGFLFPHTGECDGHHPPGGKQESNTSTDHREFKCQLRQWESTQLAAYRRYVDAHAQGTIPTNAPAYAAPFTALYMRSTGSLQSLSSYVSSRSSPEKLMLGPRRRTTQLAQLEEFRGLRSRNGNLARAIVVGDFAQAQHCLAAGADVTANGGLKRKIIVTMRHLDADMLRILLDAAHSHGEYIRKTIRLWKISEFLQLHSLDLLDTVEIDRLIECVQLLVQYQVQPDTDAVSLATTICSLALLRLLDLDAHSSCGDTALIMAVLGHQLDTVQLLLDAGASVDTVGKDGSTALMAAAEVGEASIIELLLQNKATADLQNDWGWTALFHAAYHGHGLVVDVLLRHSAALNIIDQGHCTALMYACRYSHYLIAQALLEKGADAQCTDLSGNTAITWATWKSEDWMRHPRGEPANPDLLNTIKLLIKAGAHVSTTGMNGVTILMKAMMKGDDAVGEVFVTSANLLDRWDEDGFTALMYACGNSRYAMVKLLLERGAAVNIKSYTGVTALTIACHPDNKDPRKNEIVKLLLEHGADPNLTTGLYGSALLEMVHLCKMECLGGRDSVDAVTALLLLRHGAETGIRCRWCSKRSPEVVSCTRMEDFLGVLSAYEEARDGGQSLKEELSQ